MSRIRVAVLRGGPSSLYDVSIRSGQLVLEQMPEQYEAHDIFITRDGEWHVGGLPRTPERALKHVDVVFNALHGEYGQDGKVQRMLDALHIPYTGSHAPPSSLAASKHLLKKHFEDNGFTTPQYYLIKSTDNLDEVLNYLFYNFHLPGYLRPTSGYIHYHVPVKSYRDIPKILKEMFEYSPAAVLEEDVRGYDAYVGVIDNFRNEPVYALLPYREGGENLTPEEKDEICARAKELHRSLGTRHYGTYHFKINPKRGIHVIDCNTHPALSKDSHFVQSLHEVGSNVSEFLHHVIGQALGR